MAKSKPTEPRVYRLPPAPIPMAHGCWRCGRPFEDHKDDAMWCPAEASVADSAERTEARGVIDLAATVYTREGVGLWLLGHNRTLGGWRPVDLIDSDQGRAKLFGLLNGLAEGVF